MQVDIRLVGTDSEWKLPGPRIRVGRDPGCDVALNPAQFPMVSREHIVLLIEHGHVRFSDCGSANGTYVNGVKAVQGRLLNSDRVRLGSDGPELEVTLRDDVSPPAISKLEAEAASKPVSLNAPTLVSSSDAATTMVLQAREGASGAEKRAAEAATVALNTANAPQAIGGSEPTRIIHGLDSPAIGGSRVETPPQTAAPLGVAMKTVHISDAGETPASPQIPNQMRGQSQPQSESNTARPNQPANIEGSPNTESELSEEEQEMIEQKLNSLQKLVYLLVAMLVVMLGFVVYQGQQLDKTRIELNDMRNQAGNALAQAVPALDARLKTFDDRLDSVDVKMKAEEDQMIERLHTEMETEMPKLLDKYLDNKMKQLNSQMPQMSR